MPNSRRLLAASSAVIAIATTLAQPVQAQEATPAADDVTRIQSANEIVVLGGIGFRNRSEEAVPVLSYDEQFFQRFEPLTAGDALRRVPSVTCKRCFQPT